MNYDWLEYDEIEKAKHPNLLAEIKESGYSICTISEWMGHGRCAEGNQDIWDKLTGKTMITVSEAAGLVRLFGKKMEYLFDEKLTVLSGKSSAYWRWYDENRKREKEIERSKTIKEIYDKLVEDPELLEFMKWCKSLTKEQRHAMVLMLLKEEGVVNA